jgi:hypothetical protein
MEDSAAAFSSSTVALVDYEKLIHQVRERFAFSRGVQEMTSHVGTRVHWLHFSALQRVQCVDYKTRGRLDSSGWRAMLP